MVTLGRTDGVARRVALGGIAASLLIGLAACGNAVAGAGNPGKPAAAATSGSAARAAAGQRNPGGPAMPPASRHVPLCSAIPDLTRVTFVRTVGLLNHHVREVLPTGFSITAQATVHRLATLLCALPVVPSGVMNCPIMVGGAYRLYFAMPRRALAPVVVQLSGCRVVTGLGPARQWASSAALERMLSQGFPDKFIPAVKA